MKEHLKTDQMNALSARFQTYLKGFVHNNDPNSRIPQDYQKWSQWNKMSYQNFTLSADGGSHKTVLPDLLGGSLNLLHSLGDLKSSSEVLKARKAETKTKSKAAKTKVQKNEATGCGKHLK